MIECIRWCLTAGMRPDAGLVVVLGVVLGAGTGLAGQNASPVGVSTRIEQRVLPGSKLEVIPRTDARRPIVLRILASFPHGTAHRYDFEFYGLEPGEFDLKDYLRRVDRTSTADLPRIPVKISGVLPPGQVKPNELASTAIAKQGGYTLLMILGAIVWVIGLFVILFGWRKRKGGDDADAAQRPATLAERLRPSVEAAIAGQLPPEGVAELERMLLTYWRRRLRLRDVKAGEAVAAMRRHDEAGPLLTQLELWLHRP